MEMSWSKTIKVPLWSLVTVFADYLRSPLRITHRLVAFQVSDVWSVYSYFRQVLPPFPCLLLLRWLLPLLPLSPRRILPSAPLPVTPGISSGLSCCWSTHGHWSQPGWRLPLTTFAYRLWRSTPSPSGPGRPRRTCCCCSTSQTLVLPSPH